jgi:diphthamide synthase (EF-2-diphthine--ammonia ligase)
LLNDFLTQEVFEFLVVVIFCRAASNDGNRNRLERVATRLRLARLKPLWQRSAARH